MGEGDHGAPYLYSGSKRRVDHWKAISLFSIGSLGLVPCRFDGKMGFPGSVERKCRSALPPFMHLYLSRLSSWFDYLHSSEDSDPCKSDGHARRISSYVPVIRIYIQHREHADLAPSDHLWNCPAILRNHPEGDLFEGHGYVLSL